MLNLIFKTSQKRFKTNCKNIILLVLHRGPSGKEVELKKLRGKFDLKKCQIIYKTADDSNFSAVFNELSTSMRKVMKKIQLTSLAEIAFHVKKHGCMDTDDSQLEETRKLAEKILNDTDDIHSREPGAAKHKILPYKAMYGQGKK